MDTHTAKPALNERPMLSLPLGNLQYLGRPKITCCLQSRQVKSQEALQQRAVFRLATKLGQVARNSRLDGTSLKAYLAGLKRQFEKDYGSHEQ